MSEQAIFQFSRHVNGPRATVSTRPPWSTAVQGPALSRIPHRNSESDDLTDFSSSLASGTQFMNQFLKPLDTSFNASDSGMDSSFSSMTSSLTSSLSSSLEEVSATELAEVLAHTHPENIPTDENGKPRLSIVCLTALAINDSPHKRKTISEIFQWIETKFPLFDAQEGTGWKQAIRSTLGQSKHFVKQKNNEIGGKLVYWRLRPEGESRFDAAPPRRQRPNAEPFHGSERTRKAVPQRRRLVALDEKDQVASSPDAMEGASVLLQFCGSAQKHEGGNERRVRGGYTPSTHNTATAPISTLSFLPLQPSPMSSHFAPVPPQSLPPIARSLAHARQTVQPSRMFDIDHSVGNPNNCPKPSRPQPEQDDTKFFTSPDSLRMPIDLPPPSQETTPFFIFSSPLSVQAHPPARRRLVGMDVDDDSAAAALLSLAVTPSHK